MSPGNAGISISEITRRIGDIRQSKIQVSREIASIEILLDELISTADAVTLRLQEKKKEAALPPGPGASLDEFKANIEKIVQGSLEAFGDKISAKVLAMLQELQGLTGPAREVKIRQIKEVADSEMADLSTLFNTKVESNIGEIGINEQETRGIDSNLQKLRKIRGDAKDPGASDKKNT
jgi:hypothetical protein